MSYLTILYFKAEQFWKINSKCVFPNELFELLRRILSCHDLSRDIRTEIAAKIC